MTGRFGRTSGTGGVLAVVAAAVIAALGTPKPRTTGTDPVSVIVQGRDVPAVAAAVRAAGGLVTHELGVIHAVGARLAPDQIESLKRSAVVRRVYADGAVRTSAGCGVAAWTSPVIHDNKLEWDLTNHSITTVTLSRLEVEWPADHGRLKKIDLTGRFYETLSPPPALVLTSGWKGESKERQMKSGENRTLKLEFEQKSAAPTSEYAVRVEFAEGCAVAAEGDEAGREADYPAQVGADELHALGIDGEGIGVALLDTGWYNHGQLQRGRRGEDRVRAVYDAIENQEKDAKDKYGHGTHVASIVVASDKRKAKKDGVEPTATARSGPATTPPATASPGRTAIPGPTAIPGRTATPGATATPGPTGIPGRPASPGAAASPAPPRSTPGYRRSRSCHSPSTAET